MKKVRSITGAVLLGAAALSGACTQKPPEYGREFVLSLPPKHREVWAVAPAINLSGQGEVDPLLQADLLYQQVQQVRGLTVVPVNRVAEVYAGLGIEQVQSAEQAALVCDLLGCDALLVPTVTAFDPYDPPKLGASLHLFAKPGNFARPANVDPRELVRRAAPPRDESMPDPRDAQFRQAVGMFDAANGTTRDALAAYASGRHDPLGPMGPKEYLASMDRYCGFVYAELTADLLKQALSRRR